MKEGQTRSGIGRLGARAGAPMRWAVVCTLFACGGGASGDTGPEAPQDVGATGIAGVGAGSDPAGTVGDPVGSVDPTVPVTEAPLPNAGEINLDCPEIMPLDGPQAARGSCCHRVSNLEREKRLEPNETGALEYRVQYQVALNHPKTIGEGTLVSVAIARADNEQQSTLFRFSGPRLNGEEVNGPGETTIGNGRYNCDGTYSFFGDAAAPPREGVPSLQDPTRWAGRPVPTTIDVSIHGRDRSRVAWADNLNREFSYVPFLDSGTWALDWELVTQGFDVESIETEGLARDCIGSRTGIEWTAGGVFRLYTPMAPNDVEPIPSAGEQTMCGIVAFGLSIPDPEHRCFETPRCTPGAAGCTWLKLPDSLCPETAEQKGMWGCHVGAVDNEGDADFPGGYPTSCTQEAPTSTLDPDLGATSEGQCCDPLGQSPTLPACNAWLLRQAYTAAAAEITDAPTNLLPTACQ